MKLADYGPGRTTGVDDKKDAHEQLDENRERLAQLQYMLYAESKKGLLIILQAMDFTKRKYWDDYMRAYEEAIGRCSTEWAPWFVIPANKKWYRNVAVSQILIETLEGMKVKFPPPLSDLSGITID